MRRLALGGLSLALLLGGAALASESPQVPGRVQVGPDTVIVRQTPPAQEPAPSRRGYSLHRSAIEKPVVGQPSTGPNTRISSELFDDSINGNAPNMWYRKQSGRQEPNTNNAGVHGAIGVPAQQPPGTPDVAYEHDIAGQPVNPPSNPTKRR